jgi:hypothetical protein
MARISISLDNYLISGNDRKEIINIIKKTNVETDISEGDLGSKGGIYWFPTDLIILIVGLTASGFFKALGEDAYEKLKNKIKKLLTYKKETDNPIRNAFLSFEADGIVLYFEINWDTVECIDKALKKLAVDYPVIEQEIRRLIEFNPKKITGSFSSITFIFDVIDEQWIIAHFNKD